MKRSIVGSPMPLGFQSWAIKQLLPMDPWPRSLAYQQCLADRVLKAYGAAVQSGPCKGMISIRDAEEDKVAALDAGADDYITKPFTSPELLARIRAALRRTPAAQGPASGRLVLRDVEIDFDARQVIRGKRHVRLTPKEFDLLRYLVAHANKVVTHREILQAVWGPDYGDEVDHLRVVINQLRKKIESQPSKPTHVLTEPWVGYRFFLPTGKS